MGSWSPGHGSFQLRSLMDNANKTLKQHIPSFGDPNVFDDKTRDRYYALTKCDTSLHNIWGQRSFCVKLY